MNVNGIECLIENISQIMGFKISDPPPPVLPRSGVLDIFKKDRNIGKIKNMNMKNASPVSFQDKYSQCAHANALCGREPCAAQRI